MSDPVANVDIEDVLSSIRRLVSNGPDKGGVVSEDVRDADRLVLTPSQRIDDADDGEDRDGTPDPTRAGSAGVTEAHPPGSEEPEPSLPEDGAEAFDDASEAPGEIEAEPLAVAETEQHGDAEAEMEAGVEADDDPELDGIAAMFARHEAASPSAWEPDGDDEDAFADGAEAPALDWRDAGMDDETDERIGDARDEAKSGQDGDHAAAFAGDWDADAPDDDGNAFAIEDEAVLDEEALRDLVAEIVREELMGTLGERITRNVRKLVRREIHRALNSQDFD